MKSSFVTIHEYSPENSGIIWDINTQTVTELNELNEWVALPPKEIKIAEDIKFLPQNAVKVICYMIAYGTSIDGYTAKKLKYWRYTTQAQPSPKYFKFCKANQIDPTDTENINAFNEYQKQRTYSQNTVDIVDLVEIYADITEILPNIALYNPFPYKIYLDILEQRKKGKNPEIDENIIDYVQQYAPLYDITIEEVTTYSHTAKVKYNGREVWAQWTSSATYEPTPQYTYQGKKASEKQEVNHYRIPLKSEKMPQSILKAYQSIKYFESLPNEDRRAFLADNVALCPHCGKPYRINTGCTCGKTPGQDTTQYLTYIDNIGYKQSL